VGSSSLIKRTQPTAWLKAGTGNVTVTATQITYKYDSTITVSAAMGQTVSPNQYVTITGFNDSRLNVANAAYLSSTGSSTYTITVANPSGTLFTPTDLNAVTGFIGNPKISATTSSNYSTGTLVEWRLYHGLGMNISSGTLYDSNANVLNGAVFSSQIDTNGTKYTLISFTVTSTVANAVIAAKAYYAYLRNGG
jgi:hypothetical protein